MKRLLLILLLFCGRLIAADHRTANFIATADDAALAKRVAEDAEKHRRDIAIALVGHEHPTWRKPCPIKVIIKAQPSGVTGFGFGGVSGTIFGAGELDATMTVRGPRETILVDILPHEVGHTVLHEVFKRMLPRWLDEGFCVCQESEAERLKQIDRMVQCQQHGNAHSFRNLSAMYQYPGRGESVMALYAQGHCYTAYLLQKGGGPRFVEFIRHGCEAEKQYGKSAAAWDAAMMAVYGEGIASVERNAAQWHTSGGFAQSIRTTVRGRTVRPGVGPIDFALTDVPATPLGAVPSPFGRQPLAITLPGRPGLKERLDPSKGPIRAILAPLTWPLRQLPVRPPQTIIVQPMPAGEPQPTPAPIRQRPYTVVQPSSGLPPCPS